MIRYYLYIDESGSFKPTKEEKYSSFVGGFLTENSPQGLSNSIREQVKIFKNKYPHVDLSEEDIHAAELLHPENKPWNEKENSKKYRNIDQNIRADFINRFIEMSKKQATYLIKSTNKQIDFENETMQIRYGNCLTALFREVLSIIGKKIFEQKIELYFSISRRNMEMISSKDKFSKYHRKIEEYFKDICNQKNITCSILPNDNNVHLARKLSDTACYLMRHSEKNEKLYETSPQGNNEFTEDFYIGYLLERKEYGVAYRLSKRDNKKNVILDEFKKTSSFNKNTVMYFIEQSNILIKERTNDDLLNKILNILLKKLNSTHNEDKALKKAVLNNLIIIGNKTGEILQGEYTKEIEELLLQQRKKSQITRWAEILEIRNRSYNTEFNNYFFDFHTDFEETVEEYQSLIEILSENKELKKITEDNKDYLLSKMYGTLGQANAFLNQWSKAEDYFNKSIQQLDDNIVDERSKNYLVQAYWYQSKLTEANKEFFGENTNFDIFSHLENCMKTNTKFEQYFKIVILLKLFDSNYNCLSQEKLKKLKNITSKIEIFCDNEEKHPIPLIYKWLGVLYLKQGEYDMAKKRLDISLKMCKILQSPTIQSIGLSVQGLIIVCVKKQNQNYQQMAIQLNNDMDSLIKIDAFNFNNYLTGEKKEQWMADIETLNIDNIAKWLPFAYA